MEDHTGRSHQAHWHCWMVESRHSEGLYWICRRSLRTSSFGESTGAQFWEMGVESEQEDWVTDLSHSTSPWLADLHDRHSPSAPTHPKNAVLYRFHPSWIHKSSERGIYGSSHHPLSRKPTLAWVPFNFFVQNSSYSSLLFTHPTTQIATYAAPSNNLTEIDIIHLNSPSQLFSRSHSTPAGSRFKVSQTYPKAAFHTRARLPLKQFLQQKDLTN